MINIRERERIWECPAPDVPAQTTSTPVVRPDDLVGQPAPFPSITIVPLNPIGPDDPRRQGWWNAQRGNRPGWINVYCPSDPPTNSISVFMPANVFVANTQQAADQAAIAFFTSLAQAQLACDPVVCVSLGGSAVFELLPFDQQCSGGYWFSEPVPDSIDSFVVNNPQ